MHAARLLAEAAELARKLDYQIREEDLDGAGGGHCRFSGKKWVLLDVTQSSEEQLSDVVDALREEPDIGRFAVSPQLAVRLNAPAATKAA